MEPDKGLNSKPERSKDGLDTLTASSATRDSNLYDMIEI